MKNLIKNKVFISVVLILSIILCSFSNVFAVEYTYGDNQTVDLPEFPDIEYENYVIIFGTFRNEDNYYLYLINDDLCICKNQFVSFTGDIGSTCYVLQNNTWTFYKNITVTGSTGLNANNFSAYTFVFSTVDVYANNNGYPDYDNLVFQGAPQVTAPEITLALVEQAQIVKPLATVKEILPMILITIVSIIAIWKALKFLKSVLKTS